MKQVTVLIPNFRTPQLTRLCLRLIRKQTDPELAHVIVIDNDSQDESLEYLRGVGWIELIEREAVPGERPKEAHSRALDLGLARVETPYVLSIHTDTLVRRSDWLDFLIARIEADEKIGGVGSWKLEDKPLVKRAAKAIETRVLSAYYQVAGKPNKLRGREGKIYYLRSHCALYRMSAVKALGLDFSMGEVAGEGLHQALEEAGYRMIFLESPELSRYVAHINHATAALNPQLGSRKETITKGTRRIQKALAAFDADAILADDSLDR